MKTVLSMNKFRAAVTMVMVALSVISCERSGDRKGHYNKVMILYSDGYNSLSSYLKEDIEDLGKGYLPSRKSQNALLIVSKQPVRYGDYVTKTSPCIIRMTGTQSGGEMKPVMDTLMTLEPGALLTDADNMRKCLEYIAGEFPADSYGMVLSSHATGWLPSGYFDNPSKYDRPGASFREGRARKDLPLYVERQHDPSLPPVKSVTQEVETIGGVKYSHEMEIEDLAQAIPMHLDYLLFDACLMGGIEVAYALKDKTDMVGFSQTEVLADGYDYVALAGHLIASRTPDPKSVCTDFFESYDKRQGSNRSATISLIDCRKLGQLTDVCRRLFANYGETIRTMDPSRVQAYFYSEGLHWHFDLYDIVAKAGASYDELHELSSALDACVAYKAATPKFFNLDLEVVSGFSMYLPSAGSPYLDAFYRTLAWNKATGLIAE